MFMLERGYQLQKHMSSKRHLPVLMSAEDDNPIIHRIRTIDSDDLAKNLLTEVWNSAIKPTIECWPQEWWNSSMLIIDFNEGDAASMVICDHTWAIIPVMIWRNIRHWSLTKAIVDSAFRPAQKFSMWVQEWTENVTNNLTAIVYDGPLGAD